MGYYKLPGLLSPTSGLKFADVPNGLKAITAVPVEGWVQIVALGGFYEMVAVAVTTVGAVGALLGRGKRARQAMAKVRTQVSQLRAFENELGVQPPVGFWDPLGFTEVKAGYDADVNNTPGDMGWKPPLLATDDPDTKTRRLNAEIANGRLAMMAIIGMFFQDGLTGSAWGDWANYVDSPLR